MNDMHYLRGVATLALDIERCNGCRECTLVCPHAVFEIRDKRSRIVDLDACMECGACVANCAQGALAVQPGVGCAFTLIKSMIGRAESPERATGRP